MRITVRKCISILQTKLIVILIASQTKAKLGMPFKILKHFSLKIRHFFQCKFYILATNNSNL